MASPFERLPSELIHLIVQNVHRTAQQPYRRACLAATSTLFRPFVELLTFKSLRIKLSELTDFAERVTPSRYYALRNLICEVDVAVPLKSVDLYGLEGKELSRWYHMAFANAIALLFKSLHWVQQRTNGHHPGFTLQLLATDYTHSEDFSDIRYAMHLDENALAKQFNLLVSHDFTLAHVVSIDCTRPGPPLDKTDQDCPLHLTPTALHLVLSCLPHLTGINLFIDDEYSNLTDEELDDDVVESKGHSSDVRPFLDSLPSTLLHLHLDFFRECNLLADHDLVSTQLGDLSQRLESLSLRHMKADVAAFFCAIAGKAWPRLERLTLTDWYWATPSDWSYFEPPEFAQVSAFGIMKPQDFRSIYTTVANAVKQMPQLTYLGLHFALYRGSHFLPANLNEHSLRLCARHSFVYRRRSHCEATPSSKALISVCWTTKPFGPEMDEEVAEAWQDLAMAKGDPIEIYVQKHGSQRVLWKRDERP